MFQFLRHVLKVQLYPFVYFCIVIPAKGLQFFGIRDKICDQRSGIRIVGTNGDI